MSGRSPGADEPILLDVERFEQPDDETCGPACLTQVYRFLGLSKSMAEVIGETRRNPDGGTLAVYLALGAQENGLATTLYPFDLRVFDPTWKELSRRALLAKLRRRRRVVDSTKLKASISAYSEYLSKGGTIKFQEFSRELLIEPLRRGTPILTGCSATWLYQSAREHDDEYDDIRGRPAGHFIVVCGYYPRSDRFIVRDPSRHAPFSATGRYAVDADRLLTAILLGDMTYDAVLLTLEPPPRRTA